jgi:DNA invertase Pin-like site-specific DNA recombinase
MRDQQAGAAGNGVRQSDDFRAAIYARVSTDKQTTDNQVIALREIAERRGWSVAEVYVDNGISGTTGRDNRPELDRMLRDATRGRFDVVMCWSIDRLGRSVAKVSNMMAELDAVGVRQFYSQQAIDTGTPAGRAMVQMCLVFAELERGLIVERVKAGLERARAKGQRLGRPRIPEATVTEILRLKRQGLSIRQIMQAASVGSGTVQRVLNA